VLQLPTLSIVSQFIIKNIKFKVYKNKILSLVSHGCEFGVCR